MSKIKFDSGEKQLASKTILMGLKEHAIRDYLVYCEDIGKTTLSASSLRRILNNLNPYHRERLAGVDNYYVDGFESFDVSFFIL